MTALDAAFHNLHQNGLWSWPMWPMQAVRGKSQKNTFLRTKKMDLFSEIHF
jgi:hypothetical protein